MKELEVRRQAGAYSAAAARQRFDQYGVVVLKEYLPRHSRDALRSLLERRLTQASANGGVLSMPTYPRAEFLLGDVLSIRELEEYGYIFFREELLELLRGLLDSAELVYFGDSSVQFGEGARGFHKDNVDRYDGSQDDWRSTYGLIR
ncbi:MAG: hypothetical protein ACREXP_15530, partial [Steroidobacteraceae bacterium]